MSLPFNVQACKSHSETSPGDDAAQHTDTCTVTAYVSLGDVSTPTLTEAAPVATQHEGGLDCARCEDGRASALFSPRAEEPGREAGPAAMSPGRLDGLYVVVVDAGGASARVRSIDPGVRTFPVWGPGALSSTAGRSHFPHRSASAGGWSGRGDTAGPPHRKD